jgi:ABC-2 type transport system ATP-binding protein
VCALLEAKSVHSGRSARNHLLFLAQTQGLPASRADEMLELVGLSEVAHKRAGSYSLGMGQRLGIAAAMLGDPRVLLLDEPVNGLDPEGVLWVRNLMKFLAGQGRTILVSSHLMNEVAVTADHLIVIGKGKLIAAASTADVIARGTEKSVRVRTPDAQKLAELITAAGGEVSAGAVRPGEVSLGAGQPGEDDQTGDRELLTVKSMEAPRIGELAASASLVLHELTPQLASLEDVFMDLTAGSLEFGLHDAAAISAAGDGARPAGKQLGGPVSAQQGGAQQGSAQQGSAQQGSAS